MKSSCVPDRRVGDPSLLLCPVTVPLYTGPPIFLSTPRLPEGVGGHVNARQRAHTYLVATARASGYEKAGIHPLIHHLHLDPGGASPDQAIGSASQALGRWALREPYLGKGGHHGYFLCAGGPRLDHPQPPPSRPVPRGKGRPGPTVSSTPAAALEHGSLSAPSQALATAQQAVLVSRALGAKRLAGAARGLESGKAAPAFADNDLVVMPSLRGRWVIVACG